jgi:hypothetical protein
MRQSSSPEYIYHDNSMKDQDWEHIYQQEDSRENLDTYHQNHCF